MHQHVVALSRAVVVICLVVAAGACDSTSSSKASGGSKQAKQSTSTASLKCTWPMFGQSASRTFSYPDSCDTSISAKTAPRLTQKWFHRTPDVVTATPALTSDTAFVGDWSGNFFALALDDGHTRWSITTPKHAQVYSGQIVSSAAVAEVDGEQRVFFASGKTLYSLRASDGVLRWRYVLNRTGGVDDPTEIQSSPVVADGMVIVGYDGHDSPGTRAGIVALDAANGRRRWNFDPDRGGSASGCGGIWSSPAVDLERRLVFAGSANCPTSPQGWNRFSESIFAIDLDSGTPAWTYQPRGPSNNDFDFAGAPNLFDVGGRPSVGLGGKDGVYYALDRTNGQLIWKREAARPEPQSLNYSTGGFIGATAVDNGLVVGGTAIGGPCPCLHAITTADGTIAWQQAEAAPTFAPSAIVGDVAFSGSTTDFTLRALDVHDGKVLWSQQLVGGVAGGVAVSHETVVAVAGIREPGVNPAGTESGVYAFRLGAPGATTSTGVAGGTLPPTTMAPPDTAPNPDAPMRPTCIARPCDVSFTLKKPPAGTSPQMTIHLRPQPFRIDARAESLGKPSAWVRPGSPAAAQGAVTYGVFASDDALRGSLLCVLDANFDCVSETLPKNLRPSYNRISILAIANTPELPSAAEGFDRLVTTVSLDDPVTLG